MAHLGCVVESALEKSGCVAVNDVAHVAVIVRVVKVGLELFRLRVERVRVHGVLQHITDERVYTVISDEFVAARMRRIQYKQVGAGLKQQAQTLTELSLPFGSVA